MKKTRLITAILMALMVLLLVVPALANEGEGTMDVSPGGDEEQPIPLQMAPAPPRSPLTGLRKSPPLSPRRNLPPRRP